MKLVTQKAWDVEDQGNLPFRWCSGKEDTERRVNWKVLGCDQLEVAEVWYFNVQKLKTRHEVALTELGSAEVRQNQIFLFYNIFRMNEWATASFLKDTNASMDSQLYYWWPHSASVCPTSIKKSTFPYTGSTMTKIKVKVHNLVLCVIKSINYPCNSWHYPAIQFSHKLLFSSVLLNQNNQSGNLISWKILFDLF